MHHNYEKKLDINHDISISSSINSPLRKEQFEKETIEPKWALRELLHSLSKHLLNPSHVPNKVLGGGY